jgi:hypothetical protein
MGSERPLHLDKKQLKTIPRRIIFLKKIAISKGYKEKCHEPDTTELSYLSRPRSVAQATVAYIRRKM